MDQQVLKVLQDMEIDPYKAVLEIKDVIVMSKKLGYILSPSQATEALFSAKGDIEKFKTPFNEADFKRFVKWFLDHRTMLRLNKMNYMKNTRKANNNSVNMRPSINLINSPNYQGPNVMIGGLDTFSPKNTTRLMSNTPVNDVHMRTRIQVFHSYIKVYNFNLESTCRSQITKDKERNGAIFTTMES